jgi:hypothetical protein
MRLVQNPGQVDRHVLRGYDEPETLPSSTHPIRLISADGGQAKLKEWRAMTTRYEKTASSLMGILCLAAALDCLSVVPRRRR